MGGLGYNGAPQKKKKKAKRDEIFNTNEDLPSRSYGGTASAQFHSGGDVVEGAPPLRRGTPVVISGLKSASGRKLNGTAGFVDSFDRTSGKFGQIHLTVIAFSPADKCH
jgi:hypothetical protein